MLYYFVNTYSVVQLSFFIKPNNSPNKSLDFSNVNVSAIKFLWHSIYLSFHLLYIVHHNI